jgi:UDP-2,3-diacylglucosamine pyrophosphatase LpxH
MLAIISDLHFQETTFDCLRYRAGQIVRQIGVRRNVKASAFERLTARIEEAAARRKSTEIHLVLAGDIFEILRAPPWFFGPDKQVRPVDPVGADDSANPLRRKVETILTILERDKDHAEVWAAIRGFVARHSRRRAKVTVHFVPGNHDRLVNAWPGVRRQVRRMLGMDGSNGDPFPARLDFAGPAPVDYGVRIRHGHEYDAANFAWSARNQAALDREWPDYLRPAFGDHVTVDVAMRLPLAFRAHYAQALRGVTMAKTRLPAPADMRRLYLALTEFDDVRPASLLLDYLATHVAPMAPFKTLKPILRDVVETAAANLFFTKQASAHAPGLLLKLLPFLVKNVPARTLEQVVRRFSISSVDLGSPPAEHALAEFRLGDGIRLVVAGHTHRPELVPLAGQPAPADAFYLNSGTWRTTLPYGVNGFGRLRACTMIFCYNSAEQAAGPDDGRWFESWTGHLAADGLGPYDEEVREHSPAARGAMQLRFERLDVLTIPREHRGAELRIHTGVDDQGIELAWTQVRSGDRRVIERPPLLLDPDLDGDLWFHGVEVDLGALPLNYDDPLPWALEPLPREEPRGQFSPGAYALKIIGERTEKNRRMEFLLHYRIETA